MSPEVDILEWLSALDCTLAQVRGAFPSHTHAARSIGILIRTRAVVMQSAEGALVEDWRVPRVLEDPSQWTDAYVLTLTDRGFEQFHADSANFYDEFFS